MTRRHQARVFLSNVTSENVDERFEDTMTPLHLAAQKGHCYLIEQFLDWGADVNAKDKYRRTPLHYAMIALNEETKRKNGWPRRHRRRAVDMLIRCGASIGVWDRFCSSPLDYWEGFSKRLKPVQSLLNLSICALAKKSHSVVVLYSPERQQVEERATGLQLEM